MILSRRLSVEEQLERESSSYKLYVSEGMSDLIGKHPQ